MKCIQCNAELKGKQEKFCSRNCKAKEFYKRNQIKCINKSKNYQAKHKDMVKERNRNYYQKHKETLNKKAVIKNREWRHKNLNKNREYQKKYYLKNKKKRMEYQRKWRKENPEKNKAHNRLRKYYFKQLKERKSCLLCNNTKDIVLHHLNDNQGIFICKKCHKEIHSVNKRWVTSKRVHPNLRRDIMKSFKKELMEKISCHQCGTTRKPIIFHHTDYKNDKGFYICERCHKGIHHNLIQVSMNMSISLG